MKPVRLAVVVLAVIASAGGVPAAASAGPARAVRLGTPVVATNHVATATAADPTSNTEPSNAFWSACYGMGTSKADNDACDEAATADFTSVWAAEGISTPFALPADFDLLSVPAQLLAISDVERVGRGLTPVLGMSSSLNSLVQAGANTDDDPSFPSPFPGNYGGANWAGAGNSALLDDFFWMYDDGLGSGNLDCTASDTSGCWGHRHNIIHAYDSKIFMGAAVAYGTTYGTSMATEYIGGDGSDSADVAPTWATINASTPTTAPVSLSSTSQTVPADDGATGLATVVVTAPADGASITDTVTSGANSWSVTPTSCDLTVYASCVLHLTFNAGAAGTFAGVLTVVDAVGPQSVTLAGVPIPPVASISASRHAARRHHLVTFTGRLTAALAKQPVIGQRVELQRRIGTAPWKSVASRQTGRRGEVRFHRHPTHSARYRVKARNLNDSNAATSGALKVKIR